MRDFNKIYYGFLFVLALSIQSAKAQFQLLDYKAGVDSMTFAERFSFHTNAIDWMFETPNLDVEFDVRGNSWGRWSLMLGGNYSVPVWNNKNTYYVIDNKELHGEIRKYWRLRNTRLATAYYWGLRASYGEYDMKLGYYGIRGKAVFGGFSVGTVRQLYGYPSGNSVDLELGFTVGAAFGNKTKYHRDAETYYYVIDDVVSKRLVLYPVVNEIRAGLIYRFGNFPLYRKYRRRYDSDAKFRSNYDDVVANLRQMELDKHNADSLYKMVDKYYTEQYDSVMKVVNKEEKAIKAAERAKQKQEEKAAKQLRKDAKVVAKKARQSEKATAKKLKQSEKANAKKAKEEAKAKRAATKEDVYFKKQNAKKEDDVAKESTSAVKESTSVTKESASVVKEAISVAKKSTSEGKEEQK